LRKFVHQFGSIYKRLCTEVTAECCWTLCNKQIWSLWRKQI